MCACKGARDTGRAKQENRRGAAGWEWGAGTMAQILNQNPTFWAYFKLRLNSHAVQFTLSKSTIQ